jgi:hypothetical protein
MDRVHVAIKVVNTLCSREDTVRLGPAQSTVKEETLTDKINLSAMGPATWWGLRGSPKGRPDTVQVKE